MSLEDDKVRRQTTSVLCTHCGDPIDRNSEGVTEYLDCANQQIGEYAHTSCHQAHMQKGNISQASEAVKFDSGKPRMELMPPDALIEVAKVYTMGAEKYAARNWEKGTDWGRANGALLRHLMAWMGGEDKDPESGLWHMAHVAWNALCLLAYQIRGVGNDDRFKLGRKRATQAEIADTINAAHEEVDKMRGKS